MSGRGRGLCGGRRRGNRAADAAFGPGQARRWRHGRGRGFGPGFAAMDPEADAPFADDDGAAAPETRRAILKAERNRLKARLREVEESLKTAGRDPADDSGS